MKKLHSPKDRSGLEQEKLLLSLELAEIKEVADILFTRLEQKLRAVEAAEASADGKIAELERLIQRAEAVRFPGGGAAARQHEVFTLRKRGLKSGEIAEVLGMPVGEVDLILEMDCRPA